MSNGDRILSEDQCVALAERVFSLAQGGGDSDVRVASYWNGTVRWARNRVSLGGDRRETSVTISRSIDGAEGSVRTNQLDVSTLESAAREAERLARYKPTGLDYLRGHPPFKAQYGKPAIWSDATYGLSVEERGRVARSLIEPAEAKGMLSHGYIAAEAGAIGIVSSKGQRLYAAVTQSRCSLTVRDSRGTASGWAGKTSYDWAKLDGPALAERALQKCLASRDPVALEPGRYVAILEPQAVADLLSTLIDAGPGDGLSRRGAEYQASANPFWLRPFFSKLGLKVADERVTIGQDPMDPELGVVPFAMDGDAHRTVNWIEKGVLTALGYDRQEYALGRLSENLGLANTQAFRMAGGDTSLEEMIRTTRRGLLVTRFSGLRVLDRHSLLTTGLTRDGLWLIENGKITKPIKNFRFTDSPLLMLNSIERLGPAQPVFRPGEIPLKFHNLTPMLQPAIVPTLKVRDFNFTALVDAV